VIEQRPASSSVCALENDSVKPKGIERIRVLRVDHERVVCAKALRQPVVYRVPTPSAIRAFDETRLGWHVQCARVNGVNRESDRGGRYSDKGGRHSRDLTPTGPSIRTLEQSDRRTACRRSCDVQSVGIPWIDRQRPKYGCDRNSGAGRLPRASSVTAFE